MSDAPAPRSSSARIVLAPLEDTSTFADRAYTALKDTIVSIKMDTSHDSSVPLNKGTPVTGILTYGIYLEDVLNAQCLKK